MGPERAGWSDVRVEAIAASTPHALSTGPFGSSIGAQYFEPIGIPVIRGSNLSEDVGVRLDDDGLVFLSPAKAAEFTRSVVRQGDLVFTCWGTIGQVGLIDERARYREYVISNKQMKLTPDPAKADSLFLYYLLKSPEMVARVVGQKIGSSVPGFNLGQLRALQVRLPPLPEQRAIAHILGALDDKIELNRKTNDTLEAMARALFKSWFVDFDPVRSRRRGPRPGGMVDETAALFPKRLVSSPAGDVPEGWDVRNLEDWGRWMSGGTPSKSNPEYWGGDIPWISAKSMHDFFIEKSDDMVTAAGAENGTRRVPPGSVMFVVRGMSLATEFRLGLTTREVTFNQDLKAIVPHEGVSGLLLAHFLLFRVPAILGLADEASHGTKRLQTELLTSQPLALPRADVQMKLACIFDSIAARQVACMRESRHLAVVRDTLLPKLMSGELSVRDAERAVG
jgi:type I restriction enzyme S subunit